MIGFPFDSHVTYESDGTPVFDRAISSEPYRALLKCLFTNGIRNGSDYQVTTSSSAGMYVNVSPGFAMVNGCMKLEEATRELQLQASDSADRIDTVVLRLNDNDDVRSCDLYVVKGTPATTPTPPELNRSGSIYELGLANIFVAKNSTAVSAQRITDTRYDNARCGVINPIATFDTAEFNRNLNNVSVELQQEFNGWFNQFKQYIGEDEVGQILAKLGEVLQASPYKATYGVTTFDELKALYEAGRTVYTQNNNLTYIMSNKSDSYIYFTCIKASNYQISRVRVSNTSQWLEDSFTYALATDMVTSISASSSNTKYPSAKAVYDYIQSLTGSEVSY